MDYQLTLNWPDFIERYWQKRPVVLKRGFANFIDPISPDELAFIFHSRCLSGIITDAAPRRCRRR
jgi:ribosomal protein L16 Arg81 hydroxylase